MKRGTLITILVCSSFGFQGISYAQNSAQIHEMISRFKDDTRGPYKDIRWFCKDGSVLPPQERCAEPGGIQRARYKDEVVRLSEKQHLFIGQILAGTPPEDFWDEKNLQSRLKQYQFEQYLKEVDNHWVWKKAQYYRGAIQAEDEEKWGIDFFKWILAQPNTLQQKYFLFRQAMKDVPHRGDNKLTREIRALSKNISDEYGSFMNLRVKIHGQPDSTDTGRVKSFLVQHDKNLSPALKETGKQLLQALEKNYLPVNKDYLLSLIKKTSKSTETHQHLQSLLEQYLTGKTAASRVQAGSDLLWTLRLTSLQLTDPHTRMDLTDLSVYIENQLLSQTSYWIPSNLGELLEKVFYLGQALAGTGFLEIWEWESIRDQMSIPVDQELSLQALNRRFTSATHLVQWGTLMIRACYQSEITRYSAVSEKIHAISDDWIRSSMLLSMGDAVSLFGDLLNRINNNAGHLFNSPVGGTIRGLNPGFAKGELVVVSENEPVPDLSNDKIYILDHPPADMKPVAGIATASEGNLVSHVQLLARNLGIPNALISKEVFPLLKRYSGKEVFFAVSPGNVVVMKLADQLNAQELQLFESKTRSDERVHVPIDRIDLSSVHLVDLRDVNAASSGIICGPKAANLGELKKHFPDQVVEGIVMPFGIFKKHMDQTMPGTDRSYWDFLVQSFADAEADRTEGRAEADIERPLLSQLEILSAAIRKMPLLSGFTQELQQTFQQVLGKKMGTIPVFLRSDTNMEDLKDFTGAGLNLTLFNVLEEAKILQGIRDVWASPYTERSFRWRQLFLDNPENVFPSILIIPSVNVDCSGVMITRLVSQVGKKGLTVAFSRGAGGAVEGQVAESYWIFEEGSPLLISPAREPWYNSLPASGGTLRTAATFEKPILDNDKTGQLIKMAGDVQTRITGHENNAGNQSYDIELGFLNDQLWLFQIRPFVENKNARSSEYLSGLDPVIDETKTIPLSTKTK